MKPPPMDTSELTKSSIKLAEMLEPRLQAGAKTFGALRIIVAGLASLCAISISVGVWALSRASKTDVTAQAELDTARHADLERRQSVTETQLSTFVITTNKALDALIADAKHKDDVLLDIRIRLGAAPTTDIKPPRRRPRAASNTGEDRP